MATSRTRQWTNPERVTGTVTTNGIPSAIERIKETWTTTDVIGDYGGNHSFYSRKTTWQGGTVSKSTGTSIVNAPTPLYGTVPDRYTNATPTGFNNRIMAQTGPNTPSIFLPVAIFELREIPLMLRHIGDLKHAIKRPSGLKPAKEAAAATLAYQFGWAPLIKDIFLMMKFAETMEKHRRSIVGAHSTKGIRRRVQLGGDTLTVTSSAYVWSTQGILLQGPYTDVRSVEYWGTCRWKAKSSQYVGKEPSFLDVFRVMTGQKASHIPINIWKALPWSWAIDWFADISNIAIAQNNKLYYTPSSVCLMRKSTTTRTFPAIIQGDKMVFTPFQAKSEWKERFPQSTNVSFRLKLPFIDNFKLSILGSMSILAHYRRR